MKTTIPILLLLALTGCTDRVLIEPAFTDDTTWVPIVTLEHSNYQRVQVDLGERPALEVQRNLSRLLVQYRSVGAATFAPMDTIDLEFRRLVPGSYRSAALLQEGVSYELRMVAQYRNGAENVSDTVQFEMPVIKGQRLDSIPLAPTPHCIGCGPTEFQFTKDYIYLLIYGDDLVRIDRMNQQTTVLSSHFIPPEPRISVGYEDLVVFGDTAIAAENPERDPDYMILAKVDLQTLETDKSVRIPYPRTGRYVWGRVIHYDGMSVHVLWNLEGDQQIEIVDATTGEILESYPPYEGRIGFLDDILYDGSQYWITQNRPFDNRIARYYPQTGEFGPVHRNPVFDASGLAWDGEHFWVYDDGSEALVQLGLEGL